VIKGYTNVITLKKMELNLNFNETGVLVLTVFFMANFRLNMALLLEPEFCLKQI